MSNRRKFIATVGAITSIPLTGCSSLSGDAEIEYSSKVGPFRTTDGLKRRKIYLSITAPPNSTGTLTVNLTRGAAVQSFLSESEGAGEVFIIPKSESTSDPDEADRGLYMSVSSEEGGTRSDVMEAFGVLHEITVRNVDGTGPDPDGRFTSVLDISEYTRPGNRFQNPVI